MIEIICTWLFLIVIFCGLGSLVTQKLTRSLDSIDRWTARFWVGWCVTIGLLQIWHFFFKINALVWIPVGGVALIGLLLSGRELFQWARSARLPVVIVFALLTGIFGLWLANRALVPSQLYDAALYHMQTVMWDSAYPIVRGLGNLHYRFAFNNSSFLYSAMTDVFIWNQRSYHVSNSLFVFVLLMQSLISFYQLLTNPSKRPVHLFMALMVFPAILVAYDAFYVTYSPDLPVYILGINLSAHLLAFLLGTVNREEERFHFLMIALLSFTGMTVKLSFAGLAAPALLTALAVWWVKRRSVLQPFTWSAALGVFYLLPWSIRSVLLSGYLAFPLTIGALPVAWRMPEYRVVDAREWIQSWARQPGVHWGIVNYSNDWVVEWLQKIPETVTRPLLIFLFFVLLAVFLVLASKRALDWKHWVFFVAPLVSLVCWFTSAPDIRFAGASFWILAFGAVALAFSLIDQPDRNLLALQVAAIVGITALFIPLIKGPILLPYTRLQSAPPEFDNLLVNFQAKTTRSGFTLRMPPVGSEQCWKIPIPCAAFYEPSLSLIDENDMAKGFMIDPAIPYPVPQGFSASPKVAITQVSGWYSYEKDAQQRWMASPSQFLFYVEQTATVRLSLTPGLIYSGNGVGTAGEVRVRVDKKLTQTLALRSQEAATAEFFVSKGYHLVEVINEQGNFIPKEVDPNSQDEQPRSISFSEISVDVVR